MGSGNRKDGIPFGVEPGFSFPACVVDPCHFLMVFAPTMEIADIVKEN